MSRMNAIIVKGNCQQSCPTIEDCNANYPIIEGNVSTCALLVEGMSTELPHIQKQNVNSLTLLVRGHAPVTRSHNLVESRFHSH